MTDREERIERKRLADARKRKKAWRDKNRDRVNRYQREWRERFKQEHGVSYSVYSQRKQAERELEQGC